MQMIYKMIELGIDIFQIYLIFHFLLYFDQKPIKYCFLPTLAAELGVVLLHLSNAATIIKTIFMMLAPVIVNILSNAHIQKMHIGYGLLSTILMGTIQDLSLNIIRTSGRIINYNFNRMLAGILALIIATLLWVFTTYYITHKHYGYLQKRHASFFVFISLVAALNSGIHNVFLKCIYSTDFAYYANTKIIECFLLIFGIALIAEIVYIIFLYYEKTHYSIVNDFTKEYMEIEKAHFQKQQLQEKATRRFRHDIQGHLTVMNHYANEGNTTQLIQYLHSLTESFAALRRNYQTGNDVINSILDRESTELKQHHITLEIEGNLKDFHSIEDFDLCTIFSNAFQNAKEACLQIPDDSRRHISIRFRSTDALNVLEFSNTVKEDLNLENGLPESSKPDKYNHGFGLIQIKQIVKNHNGSLYLTCSNRIFRLVASLENKKDR